MARKELSVLTVLSDLVLVMFDNARHNKIKQNFFSLKVKAKQGVEISFEIKELNAAILD